MKKNRTRILSLMLALMLIFSAAFSLSACASGGDTPPDNNVTADNDPNMTAYNGQFTVILDTGATSADLAAVPADKDYEATVFDTELAASQVNWTPVAGSGALANYSTLTGTVSGEMIGPEQYYSNYAVTIPGSITGDGSASFLATNPNSEPTANASVNITLVKNVGTSDQDSKTLSGNRYRIYTDNVVPATGTGYALAGSFTKLTALGNIDDRSYVTALDGMGAFVHLNADTSQYGLWGGVLNAIDINADNYLVSMTINASLYENGWQYRVYDKTSGPTNGQIVFGINNSSAVLGAGDFALSNDQLVVWAYDPTYEGIDFPSTITITVADEEQQ
jgi:hypothetical protein